MLALRREPGVSAHHPLKYRWTGQVMQPLVPSMAKRQFTAGETYRLEVWEERSIASHRQYFASIKEAWDNLPEHLAERFPTSEHLRKYALIRSGYRDERTIVATSKAEAGRIAAFVRPSADERYELVVVREATVTIYTPKSQSTRAMGRKEFQESKTKVLDLLAEMIGVDRTELDQNAGRAA